MNSFEKILFAPLIELEKDNFLFYMNSLKSNEKKDLLDTIFENKYAPIFFNYISKNDLTDSFSDEEIEKFRLHLEEIQIVNLSIIKEVLFLNDIFEKNNLHPVYLKGVALIGEFQDISLRPSNDIDILFSEEEAIRAFQILNKNGFHELNHIKRDDEYLINYSKKSHDLPTLFGDSNIMIDIHHRVTSPKDFNECPLTYQILNNKKSYSFYGSNIFKPEIEDLTLHLILHFSIQNYFEKSLRIFSDIKQIEKNYNIDWERIYSSNDNSLVKKTILLSLGLLNYKFEITNDFQKMKSKYKFLFPSDDILNFLYQKTIVKEKSKINLKTLASIGESDSFFTLIKSILERFYVENDNNSSSKNVDNPNKLFNFKKISTLFFRIRFYFFSVIKLIFNVGSISKDYQNIKKTKGWLK